VCCVPQTVFTAGLFASYYGRVGVLGWLVETKRLKVWNRSFSGVCFHCKPPRFHNRSVHKRDAPTLSFRCPECRSHIQCCSWLYEAAVAGRQPQILEAMLHGLSAGSTQPQIRWSADFLAGILSCACTWGDLAGAQLLYSDMMKNMSQVHNPSVSVVHNMSAQSVVTALHSRLRFCWTLKVILNGGFWLACEAGHEDVAKWLVDLGAQPVSATVQRTSPTAFMIACQSCSLSFVQWLCKEHGCDPHARPRVRELCSSDAATPNLKFGW
jgi:hypothetical protein